MTDMEDILGLLERRQRHRCNILPGYDLAWKVGREQALVEKAGLAEARLAECREKDLVLLQIGQMRE